MASKKSLKKQIAELEKHLELNYINDSLQSLDRRYEKYFENVARRITDVEISIENLTEAHSLLLSDLDTHSH